jgi:hypothetical protein
MVTPVTEKDYANAIIRIRGVMHMVRAVTKLRNLRHAKAARSESASASSHRHTKSLDMRLHPHDIKTFLHDHLPTNIFPEESPVLSPEETLLDRPLTPTIQVHEPPDEEIQYIGVGLGTLSKEDKKPRNPPPSEDHLHHHTSSESLKSDTSITSGQLTPSEPMVYISPLVTHENVFAQAFRRAEDKIRLVQGDNAMVYQTWRSEELNGEPITNEPGRTKVELEKVDQPRWVLMEKVPEKIRQMGHVAEEKKSALKEIIARKMSCKRDGEELHGEDDPSQKQD